MKTTLKATFILGLFAFLLIVYLPAAQAQEVILVSGRVDQPNNLREGDKVSKGESISTQADGLVILDFHWSDSYGEEVETCHLYVIIGGAKTYTVGGERKDCGRRQSGNEAERALKGESIIANLYWSSRGGDKIDGPSGKGLGRLAEKITNRVSSFFGIVESIGGGFIKMEEKDRDGKSILFRNDTRDKKLESSRLIGERVCVKYTSDYFKLGYRKARATQIKILPKRELGTESGRNDIRNFRVISNSPTELRFRVDYTYIGDQAPRAAYISAKALNSDETQSTGVYKPDSIRKGDGVATMSVLSSKGEEFTTTKVEVCMYIARRGSFYCETFQYSKTWDR